MPCPICGRVMCDCTPDDRGQSTDDMLANYNRDMETVEKPKKKTKKKPKIKTRKISIEQYVEQVQDGVRYKGHVKVAGTSFDYELVFGFPINQLDSLPLTKDDSEVQRLFQITVKRGNTIVELTNEEYKFFFSVIVEFVLSFYDNPQTRDSNNGMRGEMLRGRGPMAIDGVSTSIGMTSSGSYEFPPELCEMLSAPKFGCALVAA